VELGKKIISITLASVFVTAAAGLVIQRAVIRQEGINLTRDSMRIALISAENTRQSVSTMRTAGVFDNAKLKASLAGASDYRQTSAYMTVPVVAAWNSISDVAKRNDYDFRVPAHQPRNPKNAPTLEEETILRRMETDRIPEYFAVDEKAGEIIYARPVLLGADCLACHGDPATSATHDGKDALGFTMEGWHTGDQHGMFLLRSKLSRVDAVVWAGMVTTLTWLAPLALAIGLGIYLLLSRSLSRTTAQLRSLTASVTES
jgi:methyl-accepting chemotaxis protein